MKILFFVYNVDSGIATKIRRNIYGAESVECKLFCVIRGRLFVKRTWKEFLKNLPYKKVYLYKSQFREKHPEYDYLSLPSVLVKDDVGMDVLIGSDELNKLEDADDCIGLVGQKLARITTVSSHIE